MPVAVNARGPLSRGRAAASDGICGLRGWAGAVSEDRKPGPLPLPACRQAPCPGGTALGGPAQGRPRPPTGKSRRRVPGRSLARSWLMQSRDWSTRDGGPGPRLQGHPLLPSLLAQAEQQEPEGPAVRAAAPCAVGAGGFRSVLGSGLHSHCLLLSPDPWQRPPRPAPTARPSATLPARP